MSVVRVATGGPTRVVIRLAPVAALLWSADGDVRALPVAASSEAARLLELFRLQAGQGPCLDCYRTSQPVTAADLATAQRWPRRPCAPLWFAHGTDPRIRGRSDSGGQKGQAGGLASVIARLRVRGGG